MKRPGSSLFWCALLVFVMMGVYWGGYVMFTIPHDFQDSVLLAGDRVVVGRWDYGYRVPFSRLSGYRRWAVRPCRRSDWVVFNAPASEPAAWPDTSRLCIGQCIALPGDTVWVGAHGRVSLRRNYAQGQIWPLVVPGRGTCVHVAPWNAALYARVINQHESGHAAVQGDSLCVDGRCVPYFCFSNDYYWMFSGQADNLNDSRLWGFVPHQALLGRIHTVAYSLDGWKPRKNRFSLPR